MEPVHQPQEDKKVKATRRPKHATRKGKLTISQQVDNQLDTIKGFIPQESLNNFNEVKESINSLLKEQENKPKETTITKTKRDAGCTGLGMVREPTDKLKKFMAYGPNEPQRYSYLELNKRICSYVKEGSLQKPDNKRSFRIDNALKELLELDDSVTELTFTTVMNHYNHLFVQPTFPIGKGIVDFAVKAGLMDWKVGDRKTIYNVQHMVEKYLRDNKLYENDPAIRVAKAKRKIVLNADLKALLKVDSRSTTISQTQFERHIKTILDAVPSKA